MKNAEGEHMETFLDIYTRLKADNLDLLAEIYTPDIHFIDPVHKLRGLGELRTYFSHLYANLTSIHFAFTHPQRVGEQGYVQWLMTYSHPRINGGRSIEMPGATFLQFNGNGRVCIHRDYYDLGAMLYQHLPLLGPAVRYINGRLAK